MVKSAADGETADVKMMVTGSIFPPPSWTEVHLRLSVQG